MLLVKDPQKPRNNPSRTDLASLTDRLDLTAPSFQTREGILNMRRNAYRIRLVHADQPELFSLTLCGSVPALLSRILGLSGCLLRKLRSRPIIFRPLTVLFCKPRSFERISPSYNLPSYIGQMISFIALCKKLSKVSKALAPSTAPASPLWTKMWPESSLR